MALSKKATCDSHGQDSSYFLGWQEYEKNPYHETTNPNGIIQMGLAENKLCFDLLESWLSENPDPASFNKNGDSIFRELALFQDYHGLPSFKNALVQFMSDTRGNKVSFDPDKLVLTAGATSANETLIFCLADPGEAFLVPTPYYPGFDRDLKWRTGVEIVPVQCTSSDGFRITGQALDHAYRLAQNQNLRVKGVLVTNPSNPLGTTLTRPELNLLLDFSRRRNIHIVSDEIYSGTAFGHPKDFVSAAELLHDPTNADLASRVHIVYSLSKDLGLPGFRVGCIYSTDPRVVDTATKMSSFGLVSSQTQHLLAAMLSDRRFSLHYLAENRRRLRVRQARLVAGLAAAGIPCFGGNAGLFCWVDMRGLMGPTRDFDAEMRLWRRIIQEVGINISAGGSCHCSEPGWFRVCFANMSEDTLDVAIRRLRSFVDSIRGPGQERKPISKWVFRLSFGDRERER